MADKGFDIDEDLIPLGVKSQFDPHELVQTRRIASLQIHVERTIVLRLLL